MFWAKKVVWCASIGGIVGCTGQPTADITKPVVSVSASSTGFTMAGTLTLSATANDMAGVTRVEFYKGSSLLASDTSVPYEAIIHLTSADNGVIFLKAKAYDAAGNVGESNTVEVLVNISTPPPPGSPPAPPAVDTASPTIVKVSPADGENGVSRDAKITVVFSEAMNRASAQAAFQSADIVGVTFTWDAEGKVLSISPNSSLEYAPAPAGKVYRFQITDTATDLAGNKLQAARQLSFTTLKEYVLRIKSVPNLTLVSGKPYFLDGVISKVEVGGTEKYEISERNAAQFFLGEATNPLFGSLFQDKGIRGFFSFDLSPLGDKSPVEVTSAGFLLYFLGFSEQGVNLGSLVLENVLYGEIDESDFDRPATDNNTAVLGILGLDRSVGYQGFKRFAGRNTLMLLVQKKLAELKNGVICNGVDCLLQLRVRFAMGSNRDDARDFAKIAGGLDGPRAPILEVRYLAP